MTRATLTSTMFGALMLLQAGTAKADLMAVTSVTGGTLFTSGSDQVYGMVFHVNTAIQVTALGLYDSNAAGLSIAHSVGIYAQSTQSLLTSATVAAGPCALTVSSFCFTTLGSPVLLNPGNYVSVLTMPQGNADTQFGNASAIGTASEISFISSAFDEGATLHFPNPAFNGAFGIGFAGPNFLFTAATVPEPGSIVLLVTVILGVAGTGRRRKWLATRRGWPF